MKALICSLFEAGNALRNQALRFLPSVIPCPLNYVGGDCARGMRRLGFGLAFRCCHDAPVTRIDPDLNNLLETRFAHQRYFQVETQIGQVGDLISSSGLEGRAADGQLIERFSDQLAFRNHEARLGIANQTVKNR